MPHKHHDIAKKKLDTVSRSFCLAKWFQVTLHLQNGFNHSCHHPGAVRTPVQELENNVSALHNTKFKKKRRKEMLEGIRCGECQYCWNIEDLPGDHTSDRTIKSSAAWALPHFDKVLSQPWDADINPTYVEVSFSNVCNFKCSYCSPVYSSQWVGEVERFGPYPTSSNFNDLEYLKQIKEMPIHHTEENPYVDAFWKWWPDLVKDLEVFRITGGEPLLDKNTFKVFDFLYENPQPNLEFAINTNGCVPDKNIKLFIEKVRKLEDNNCIKSFQIFTSADTAGKQAEYIRNGLDYNQWKKNIDLLLTSLPKTRITIMCTTNILSVTNFKPLLEFVLEMKLKHFKPTRNMPLSISMSVLRWPGHQNVGILTDDFNSSMDESLAYMKEFQENANGNECYLGFFEFEIERMERFIQTMKSGTEEIKNIPQLRKDFVAFVDEHDRRRGTNFLETFPELEDFYKLCKNTSNLNLKII